jgi:hemolysin activation/secretion protein
VGDGVAYGNLELRWIFLRSFLFKQNFYLGLTTFADAGQVVQDIHLDKSNLPADFDYEKYFERTSDGIHTSLGMGLRAALNENFILSIDYGIATNRQDGTGGLYVGISNLF